MTLELRRGLPFELKGGALRGELNRSRRPDSGEARTN